MAEVLAAEGAPNEETIKTIQSLMLNIGKEEVALRLYKHGVIVNDVFKTNMLTEDEIEELALDVLLDCIEIRSRVVAAPVDKETGRIKTAIILLKFTQNISSVCSGVQKENLEIDVLSAVTSYLLPKSNPAREIIERVLDTTKLDRLMDIQSSIGHRVLLAPVSRKSKSDKIDDAIKILEEMEDG